MFFGERKRRTRFHTTADAILRIPDAATPYHATALQRSKSPVFSGNPTIARAITRTPTHTHTHSLHLLYAATAATLRCLSHATTQPTQPNKNGHTLFFLFFQITLPFATALRLNIYYYSQCELYYSCLSVLLCGSRDHDRELCELQLFIRKKNH